jgi:hypothetical protein
MLHLKTADQYIGLVCHKFLGIAYTVHFLSDLHVISGNKTFLRLVKGGVDLDSLATETDEQKQSLSGLSSSSDSKSEG